MHRRHFILSAVAAAIASPYALAQVAPTVKGSNADLRGAKTVYVDASYDRALRDAVVAELKAQLPELAIEDDPDGADLVVRCSRAVADRDRRNTDQATRPPFDASDRTTTPAEIDVPRPNRPGSRTEERGTSVETGDGPFDDPSRFLLGSVVRPVPGGPSREVFSVRLPVRLKAESAARDLVKKLAKELKKANKA